jgi:4-amino-4-deoxy-L-arabinose transferase-like glycosyltransferase
VALVLGLALVLRFNDYAAVPPFIDNKDEVQFAWAGMGLIESGDPYTWSYFPGYLSYTRVDANGTNYPMVHHWMDHPPLFSYLMGGWVMLLGDRRLSDVKAWQVRILPILFAVVSVLLAYLLARRFVGRGPALIGAGLLATAPGAVLLSRQAEPEALQAVLLLAALLLTLRVAEARAGPWTVAALLLCAVAAPLAKVSGVAVAGICGVILIAEGRLRLAAATLGAGAAGLALFAVYGAVVDWQLFVRILAMQAGNRLGVMSAFDFITAQTGVNRTLRDGWWILGWLALGLLALGRLKRRELYLVWPAAAYAVVMLLMAGARQIEQYGWYKVMVYPEIYVAAGWLAWRAVSQRSLGLLTLLLALGGATATNWWLGGIGRAWVPDPLLLVALLVVVLLPAALLLWRPSDSRVRTWARGSAFAALAVMLLGNAVESFFLADVFRLM